MTRDWIFQLLLPAAGVFAVTLLCYVITLPDTITLEDAGLFQVICHNGGIGHPPGYPLFVLACQQFVSLPFFGAGVLAANLLSALFASSACVVLFLLASRLLQDTLVSTAVAICFGLSMTFWSQAIIVEVYSLAVLMFLLCALLALRFSESGSFRDLLWLAFLFGVSLSNHWPLQLLATPALIALVVPRWQLLLEFFTQPLRLLLLVAAGCAGLLPYLSLLQDAPAFAVYGGVETLEDFARYISRAAYSDHSELAGWGDRLQYQSWLIGQSFRELSLVLGVLVIAGIYRSFIVLPVSVAIALVLVYLSGTSLLNLLLGFEFNEFRLAIFAPYPVVAYVALALWMGLGLQWVLSALVRIFDWVEYALPLLVCTLTFVGSYPAIAGPANSFAQRYGEMVLKQVPPDSVLFVEGDSGVGLLGYLHHVRGDRQDIELRSWNNLVFSNRLVSPATPRGQQDLARETFINASESPVFSTSHGETALHRGLVFQHKVGAGYHCDGTTHDYIEYLVQLEQNDVLRNGHERDLLFQLLSVLTHQHLALQLFGEPGLETETRVLDLLQSTVPGKFVTLEVMSQVVSDEPGKARLRKIGEELGQSMPVLAPRKTRGMLAAYRARLELQGQADPGAAKPLLEESIALYPLADNPGVCLLHATYRRLGLHSDLDALIKVPEAVTCE